MALIISLFPFCVVAAHLGLFLFSMSRLITLILVTPNLFVLKVVVIFLQVISLISGANSENIQATALP